MHESLLPLARWGNALRAARVSRRRLRRHAAALALLGAGLAVTIAAPPRPILVWNASASAPVGLYAVAATAPLKTGDMVIARIPGRYRQMAARRHYLPANVPLVKRVAAEPGDTICARGAANPGKRKIGRRAACGRRRGPRDAGLDRLRDPSPGRAVPADRGQSGVIRRALLRAQRPRRHRRQGDIAMAPLRIIAAALLLIATPARGRRHHSVARLYRRGQRPVRCPGGVDRARDARRKRRSDLARRAADHQPRGRDGPHAADAGNLGDMRGALGLGADPHDPAPRQHPGGHALSQDDVRPLRLSRLLRRLQCRTGALRRLSRRPLAASPRDGRLCFRRRRKPGRGVRWTCRRQFRHASRWDSASSFAAE
jgi:hypothetical protein